MLTDNEHKYYSLRDKVDDNLARFDFENADAALSEMESMPASKDKIQKQFILRSRAAINLDRDGDRDRAFELLVEAMKLTVSKFREEMVQ